MPLLSLCLSLPLCTVSAEPSEPSEPSDPVARLAARLESGELELPTDPRLGPLPALLELLEIPVESQTLVFSRTSFQAKRISPERPRALFFGDEVYVGYVPGSSILELSALDPERGLLFYTLRDGKRIQREDAACMQCHTSKGQDEVAVHLLRSVQPDRQGEAVLRAGTTSVDDRTPYPKRWGGWYVSGSPAGLLHLGNRTLDQGEEYLVPAASDLGQLENPFDASLYPGATSDVVALLVLEHQTHVQNVFADAARRTQRALEEEQVMKEALGDDSDERLESTEQRIGSAALRVVDALLMVDEPELPVPLDAETPFARAFSARGRRDSKGRSLRDFDLEDRLWRYPLSYLIDSPGFAGLPSILRERVWRELWLVLQGIREDDRFAHLTRRDRKLIYRILSETEEDLPSYW